MEEKIHAAVYLLVEEKVKITPGIAMANVQFSFKGCPECLIMSLALAVAKDERFRKIFNAAGIMANKMRRGEMDKPDICNN